MIQDFTRYVLPAFIGMIAAIITTQITSKFQKRKLDIDDAACLREALMNERKQLINEITMLQNRCDKLEEENMAQATKIIKLIAEIKQFGINLNDT